MKRPTEIWIAAALLVLCAAALPARGQGLTGWYAIERPAYAATTNYGSYAPPACAGTIVSTRWESAAPAAYPAAYAPPVGNVPVAGYVPMANYVPAAAPPFAAPRVTYMPVVARYPAPNYVSCARPATSRAPAAPAGPKVWVHPKVYVEGQPIRNLIRAITP